MTTRTSLPGTGLIKIAAAVSLCWSWAVWAETATDTALGFTTDQVVTELRSSGFEAKIVTDAPPPTGATAHVLTGTSGAKVLIATIGCPAPNPERICGLTFLSIFPDAGAISNDGFFALNAVTISKVLAYVTADGRQTGFRVFYAYPCQGFPDAKFVPMVLRTFGDSLSTVLAAYRALGAAKPSMGGGRPKTPDLEARVPSEDPNQYPGS